MRGVADANIPHPIEKSFQGDACFRTREWRAGAGVRTAAEGNMVANVRSIDIELIR